MLKNRRSSLLLIVILVVLAAIPLTVWLVVNTQQLLDRRAADDEVTINLVPASIEASLGETFTVDIYLNAGALKVSGATVSLHPQMTTIPLKLIDFVTDETSPYDDVVYDPQKDPYTFTVLVKRPEEDLPSGSFKVASATFQATGPGASSLTVNTEASAVVGVKPDSDQVNFLVSGTETALNITGSLCRIEACTQADSITLIEQPRDDRKYNIGVSWDEIPVTDTTLYFYKVHRAVESPVGQSHTEANLVSTTVDTEFLDTNSSQGFEGSSTVHYDIDTYIVCPTDG